MLDGASHAAALFVGIGDDAAVVRGTAGKETVITADLLVEDIDFRRTTTPPYLLGQKLQQAERWFIRPLQIVEDQEHRARAGRIPQECRDAVE